MGTKKVDVRFETELWEQLERFRIVNRIETPSAAIRALVVVGLRDTATIEQALVAASISEGHKRGLKQFRDELETATKASTSV